MITSTEIDRREREFCGQPPVPETADPYEQRLVAYIDIVGWTNACKNPDEDARVATVARRLSGLPHNFSGPLKKTLGDITPGVASDPAYQRTEVVTFSDNLAISTPVGVNPALFFRFITIVCRELITQGFLARGGVTLGNLCHRENMIFGPALIDAVDIEKKTSYPRLECSEKLVSYVKSCAHPGPGDENFIIDDQCGCQVVNLLAFVKRSNPSSWVDIEKSITASLRTYAHEPYIIKWEYMRDVLPKMICAAS